MALHALLVLASACGSDPAGNGNDRDALAGGVLATFTVEGERFRLWVTSHGTIQQLFDLRDGRSGANIPNGPLRPGPGQGAHNDPWGWHLDPAETSMAEFTIELCSGLPSFVQANLGEWLGVVGQYCPWSAELVELVDFR